MNERPILDKVRKQLDEALSTIDNVSFEKIGTIRYSQDEFHIALRGNFLKDKEEK